MPREPPAKRKRARIGERTSLPGQHPLTTDKEACAPKLYRSYFSSSVIRSNKLCSSSASGREVNAHRSAEEINYGLGGGDGRGLGVGACLGVVVGVAVGVMVAVGVGVILGVGVAVGVMIGVAVGVAVGVGVGPEGVMLKAPLVEELFWKRTSLATIRTRTSGIPVDGGSCQS